MSSRSWPDGAALPPPASLAIHLDLVGGLAGDMFVAAMVDALPALEPHVLDALARVAPAGAAAPDFREVQSGGLRAKHFGVAAARPTPSDHDHGDNGGSPENGQPNALHRPHAVPAASHHVHAGAAAAHHAHGGTAYSTLHARIERSALEPSTRKHALALLESLGAAEARVHGTAIEHVHFHELADWDSLMDIVAAGCIAALLDGAQWSASALPVGGGNVRTAHGVLPVPTPATSALLIGYPFRDDGVAGERVTPTGAAILRHLVAPQACASAHSAGRLAATGYGAGTRTLPGIPNVTRVSVFERAADAQVDTVSVLEFDVDDMSGEEIAVAADRLRRETGVIDVSVGTRGGKKGRPIADFRLLAQTPAADEIANACFVETSTLGLRVREERRRVLARTEVDAGPNGAALSVKVAQRPGGARTAKTAHDDVAELRGLDERRRTRAAAERRALESGDS